MQVPGIQRIFELQELIFLAREKRGRAIRKLQGQDSNGAAVGTLH
jgi:hypothetical protein